MTERPLTETLHCTLMRCALSGCVGDTGPRKPTQQRTRGKCIYAHLRSHTQPTWKFAEASSGLFLGRKLETRPIGVRGGSDDRQRKWAIENEKRKANKKRLLSMPETFFVLGKRIGASHSDSAGQRKDSAQGGYNYPVTPPLLTQFKKLRINLNV